MFDIAGFREDTRALDDEALDGQIVELTNPAAAPKLQKTFTHNIEAVVDRLVATVDQRSRIADSLELAFREGKDRAMVMAQKSADAPWREIALSQSLSCELCGDVFEKLTPRHFSFNHREGACPTCDGLGRKLRFVPELIVPDPDKSVREGAIKPWRIGGKNLIIKHNALLKQLATRCGMGPCQARICGPALQVVLGWERERPYEGVTFAAHPGPGDSDGG